MYNLKQKFKRSINLCFGTECSEIFHTRFGMFLFAAVDELLIMRKETSQHYCKAFNEGKFLT